MENPSTWGEAEHVISGEIDRYYLDVQKNIIGFSLIRRIADALREADLLKDE